MNDLAETSLTNEANTVPGEVFDNPTKNDMCPASYATIGGKCHDIRPPTVLHYIVYSIISYYSILYSIILYCLSLPLYPISMYYIILYRI